METQQRQTTRNTWVTGSNGRGQIQPYQDTGPGYHVELATAYQNIAPSTAEHTSGRDRAKALLWRSVPLLALELVLSISIVGIAAYLMPQSIGAGQFVIVVLFLWGVGGLLSYLWLSEREQHHSSTGVEHHRIDDATEIALAQIDSDKEVRLEALKIYVAHLQIESGKSEQKQLGKGPLL